MGYNVSKLTVYKWEPLIEKIAEHFITNNSFDPISWKITNPNLLRATHYGLRQALVAAHKLGIEPYNKLKDIVRLRTRNGTIYAERIGILALENTITNYNIEATTNLEVIKECMPLIKRGPAKIKVFGDISPEDTILKRWAENLGLSLSLENNNLIIESHEKTAEKVSGSGLRFA